MSGQLPVAAKIATAKQTALIAIKNSLIGRGTLGLIWIVGRMVRSRLEHFIHFTVSVHTCFARSNTWPAEIASAKFYCLFETLVITDPKSYEKGGH